MPSSCYSRDVSFIFRLTCADRLGAPLLLALLFTAACESNPTPTAPSGVLQVTTSASTLRSGDTATVTAASAGAPVTGLTWTSSDASVASVTVAGLVTARRSGRVIITASAGTAAGQVAVHVVPDFAGTWSGPLLRVLPSCAPASTAPVCVPTTSPDVLLAPMTLTVTQSGGVISGTLVEGLEPLLVVPLEGSIDDSDALLLAGRSPAASPAVSRRLTVTGLRATYDPTVQTLSGAFTLLAERRATSGAFVSDYSLQAQFRDITRRRRE